MTSKRLVGLTVVAASHYFLGDRAHRPPLLPKPRTWARTVLSGLPSSRLSTRPDSRAEIVGRRRRICLRRIVGRGLGKAILLGREFLVANDIIRTVAISPRASGYLP